jgi:hypothetical protein
VCKFATLHDFDILTLLPLAGYPQPTSLHHLPPPSLFALFLNNHASVHLTTSACYITSAKDYEKGGKCHNFLLEPILVPSSARPALHASLSLLDTKLPSALRHASSITMVWLISYHPSMQQAWLLVFQFPIWNDLV